MFNSNNCKNSFNNNNNENNENIMSGEMGSNQNNKIVEMVYSLLEMLRLSSPEEMSTKLLMMSQSPQICREMRQYGCLPILIQLLHQQMDDKVNKTDNTDEYLFKCKELRERASKTLRNIIINSAKNRREVRVLRLIEDLRAFVDVLRSRGHEMSAEMVDHPSSAVAQLMKVSFDEQHRQVIGLLGGVYAIAEVIQYDYDYHKNNKHNACITLRRYSLMTLTNLTFGDSQTKSLLGTIKPFMNALVHNLESPAEELRQVVASVLRNLSWRADYISKQILRDVGAVTFLAQSAMEATKESTLKSILSALWNLTAHCAPNKSDFCKVEGALTFLISTLTYTSTNNTITIVENGGGILRNISSYIVTNEDLRQILRKHNVIAILLDQLKSPSLTIVSNSCATLWNLSARCQTDQSTLWDLGAVPMLRNLVNSRHKMIAMGASATLRNLFNAPMAAYYMSLNGNNRLSSSNSCSIPSLHARKLKALKNEINCNLSETCENIESPKFSPTHQSYHRQSFESSPNICLPGRMYNSFSGYINPHQVSRSDSHDSIGSTHSEPVPKFRTIDSYRCLNQEPYVYPINSHVIPHGYATLPLNSSKSGDKDYDMTSDFDLYCGESGSQMNMSYDSRKSAFTDSELDADPEPTDYSQRYKEKAVDEFTAPRSRRTEVIGCEDSVKVYRTEGTPLNFSLASSLSDLREVGLKSINEEKEVNQKDKDDIKSVNSSPDKPVVGNKPVFKKPTLPPKPKLSILMKNAKIADKISSNCDNNNSKTVTPLQSQQQTPLMFSRSSSMGSLSSCDVKFDLCQSSVVSELSTRPSGVISPSDLPDSPFDSRPSSPKPISDLSPNSDSEKMSKTKINDIVFNDNTVELEQNSGLNDSIGVFEDKPINFATEGTPAMFSLSTSLSSLHEDMSCLTIEDSEIRGNNCIHEDLVNDSISIQDIKPEISSLSEDEDDGEDELLAACISSGINKVSNNKSISHNFINKIDSKKVVTEPKSIISLSFENPKEFSQYSRSAPDGQSYLETDCVQVFHIEDTPITLSHATSISELSIITNSKHDMSLNQSHNHSDDSEDEDFILQKCIESGMAANVNVKTKSDANKSSPKIPKTPNISPNISNDSKSDLNCDKNKRFFVEDTPIQLSQCHSSLSSLSFESDDGLDDQKLLEAVINSGMNKQNKTLHTKLIDDKNDNSPKMHFEKEEQNSTLPYNQNELKKWFKSDINAMVNSVMISSTVTDSSCISDLDHTKPPSLMDNSMFSSTESFSYKHISQYNNDNCIVKNKSADSLLDNVKPPSLMEDISMTQSCASVSSDISDLAIDFLSKNENNNEMIANAAKNCCRDLNTLTFSYETNVQSADDVKSSPTFTKPGLINRNNYLQMEYELSDSELSEDLPIDSEEIKTNSNTNSSHELTAINVYALPLESPTICADVINAFDNESSTLLRKKDIISAQDIKFDEKRMSPIGSENLFNDQIILSEDESDPDTNATYNVNSPRRAKIVKPVIRKNKVGKDESKYLSQIPSLSHSPRSPTPQSSSKHKCVVKPTRTSALRASRSRSTETHFDDDLHNSQRSHEKYQYSHRIKSVEYVPEINCNINNNVSKNRSQKNSIKEINSKNKEKSLLSNMKSRISASFSSHNLGSSNVSLSSSSSNGLTPSCASFPRRIEVQSRIASLWKRSKSSPNEKTDNKNSNKNSDLSRSITARRSFGKSSKSSSTLLRSSTYEKLPQNADEANQMNNNNKCEKHEKNNHNSNRDHCEDSKRRHSDKTNANSIYNSIKSMKIKTSNKNANNMTANNNILNKSTPDVLMGNKSLSNMKSLKSNSDRSRRTCLVTAV